MANETINFNIGGIDHPVKDPNAYVKPSTGIPKEHLSQEVQDALDGAGSGDGTVTGIKVGSTTYEPTDGVVDISHAIPDTSGLATKTEVTQGLGAKVDKVTGKQLSTEDYTSADKTKLANIEPGAEVNVISGIKTNGASTTLPVDQNGVVELPPASATISPATAAPQMDGTAGVGSSDKYAREDHVHPHDTSKLSKSDVSVETQGDGTVDIKVKDDTYTINLNHTHENMAKLVVCEESDLPSTLDMGTIYAQVDNASSPTEIEKLWIAGCEFAGEGGSSVEPTLPTGYVECEYVQSSDPTIIVTNIAPVGSKWRLDLEASPTGGNQIFICSKADGGLFASVNTDGNFALGAGNVLSSATTRTEVSVEFITDGTIMTIGSVSTQRNSATNVHHGSYVNLLGFKGNYKYEGKIYRIKCTKGGFFNGIPAREISSGDYGIYDLANGLFYTGNFTGVVKQ